MDTKVAKYFDDIIVLAQARFEQVEYKTDVAPKRAILSLKGKYNSYQVVITELFSDDIRKYRYYVLRDTIVEAGFDNSPDPRAIRLKYGGKIGKKHAGEHIPHLHLENKARITLTEEMTFLSFIEWLQRSR